MFEPPYCIYPSIFYHVQLPIFVEKREGKDLSDSLQKHDLTKYETQPVIRHELKIKTDLTSLSDRIGIGLPWDQQVLYHLARKDEFKDLLSQLFSELKQESILQSRTDIRIDMI